MPGEEGNALHAQGKEWLPRVPKNSVWDPLNDGVSVSGLKSRWVL